MSTPSGLTLPGVVRHLENVERSWIRDVFAGEEGLRGVVPAGLLAALDPAT